MMACIQAASTLRLTTFWSCHEQLCPVCDAACAAAAVEFHRDCLVLTERCKPPQLYRRIAHLRISALTCGRQAIAFVPLNASSGNSIFEGCGTSVLAVDDQARAIDSAIDQYNDDTAAVVRHGRSNHSTG